MTAVGVTREEVTRLRVFFSGFGLAAVFLLGWLAYVQVAQAGKIARKGRAPLPLDA